MKTQIQTLIQEVKYCLQVLEPLMPEEQYIEIEKRSSSEISEATAMLDTAGEVVLEGYINNLSMILQQLQALVQNYTNADPDPVVYDNYDQPPPADQPLDYQDDNQSGNQVDQPVEMITESVHHEDDIVMENVGPIRAWWNGLGAPAKTLIKAAGVGLLFYGGKKVFEQVAGNLKKEFAGKEPESEPESEEYEEEPEEYEEPEPEEEEEE